MAVERHSQSPELGDAIQLDSAETLDGDPNDDPLDSGYVPPDRPSVLERRGNTVEEEIEGESLDERLAEEEPDVSVADSDPDPAQQPDRAGRLVAEDEGVHSPDESDLVASDTGLAGGAASAEEAAVHIVDEDGNAPA